ncbi:hypothetical protein C5F49_01170 [Nitrosopumilus oxyclinae]|uniref:histidine kinase n=1 Tax=Nitrosopumilus oxyclinae TaxID=1959104 RepID=A0A7D5R9T2_9ARCH|nr:HAMP domain-containing sensor histidine kinase [Nitrosopumilus oxyclinae]QLH04081.1 hypothetical protein C5F49_01170 [Nitrosopumilus oxyclinae]
MQWQYSQEIKAISEYHKIMSIPSITVLQQIKTNFQEMHMTNMMIINENGLEDTKKIEEKYQKSKNELNEKIDDYFAIAYKQNPNGEYLASAETQEQILDCVSLIRQSVEDHDKIFTQFQNNQISSTEIIPLIEKAEIDFHNVIDKNSRMEISTMEQVQSNVNKIEENMKNVFLGSSVAAIITAIIIIMFTSRFISKPISELIEITKEISMGNFNKKEIKSINSDVNEISISLNNMSEELEKYKSKIIMQEKLSSIGELASRLAHDIKNPLTVIKVSLDLIKSTNKNLSTEDIEKFERIEDAMYRITHQIDNVLDFIKGKPMEFVNHKIKEILDSVINDLPKSNKISMEIVSEDSEIECDFEAMKVVLINLVINSMHAIEDEGKIKINSKVRGDKVIIQIEDSGPGIPKEKLEKIFEPLYTTKQEGTGLGLASCKSIIEQHNGKISVKNNPTRFIIELPKKINQSKK